jgi:hypothetical protein
MKFSIIVTCTFYFILTACVVQGSDPTLQAQGTSTLNPQTFAPEYKKTTLSEKSHTSLPALPALQLVTLDDAGDRLSAHPVDPFTLEDLPDYPSIDFGHHYTYAISPDGRTMALITWPKTFPTYCSSISIQAVWQLTCAWKG